MATTTTQDKNFLDAIINRNILQDSIEWIKNNLEPSDVFSNNDLVLYASNQRPDDIFSRSELSDWAESNGFVKE